MTTEASPALEERRLEIQLENEYSSCCSRSGTTDKRLIQYASRFSISVLSLVFAGVQLVRASECDGLIPFYSSLITFILGAWVKVDAAKQVNTA